MSDRECQICFWVTRQSVPDTDASRTYELESALMLPKGKETFAARRGLVLLVNKKAKLCELVRRLLQNEKVSEVLSGGPEATLYST